MARVTSFLFSKYFLYSLSLWAILTFIPLVMWGLSFEAFFDMDFLIILDLKTSLKKQSTSGKQEIAPVFHHQLQKKNRNLGFETKHFQTILTLIFPLWFHCYFAEGLWNHLCPKRCWQALCCTHFCDFLIFHKLY